MRWRAFLVVAGIVATLGAASSARAADFTVTTLNDGAGSCAKTDCTTIRAALVAAGQTAETDDTVTVPPGTTTLSSDLVPPSGVAIIGASARTTIIQGDGKARIFTIGGERIVTFQNLTMADGTATGAQGGDLLVGASAIVGLSHVRVTGGDAAQGAGIAATAPRTLLIVDSLIDHNIATAAPTGAGGDGGGLYFQGTSAARTLQINDTTVAFNTARNGGGIDLVTNAQTTATMTRLTVARNTSTVSRGGGIHMDSSGTISSTDSIFANNTGNVGLAAPVAGPANCTVTFGDGGGNLESQSDCGFKLATDRQNVDPGLSADLFDAGGQTDLLTVPSNSAAVGLAGDCTGIDQRDMPRPQGSTCDSGAYEYVDVDTTITGGPSGTVGTALVTFTYTSTDPLAGFQCRLDGPGSTVGTFTKCGSSVTYRSLADGAYTFRVRAVHGDLVDASPATQTFTMDTTAPVAPTITAPPDNSFQNSTTVTLSGTAEAGATVEVFEGATSRGTVVATGGTWTRSIPSVGEGSHTYTATARDAAGNVSGNSNARTITVDVTAPAAPVIGGSNSTQNTNTVTLTGTAEPGATVTVLEGATTRGTASAPNGAWTVTLNSVSDGSHSYVATARDAAGNSSGNSNTRTITVDTTAPAAPVIGGSNGAQNTSTVTLTGTAEANAVVEVFEGATSRGSAVATGGNWTVTVNGVADGAHNYVARATDAAGNVSGSSNTRTITVDTVAPNAPIIGGANATQNSSTVTLTGTGEAGATITVLEGATTRGTATATGGTWSVTINSVADGSHSYVVTARDAAGNTSGNSNTRTIVVDTVAPNAPVIGGSNGAQNTSTVTLSGTAEAGATVTVLEGATTRGTATATGGNWTVTINIVADGTHSYVATARDAAGNTSGNSNTRTITVDTLAPNAPVIGGSNGAQNSSTVTLSGTAEAGATVEVFEGAASRGTTTATGGNWTMAINGVADGIHSYVATARDAAGNVSGNSNTRTITVDTAAPAAPVIGGSNGAQNTTTVTLSGTAEANAVVEVFEGATSRGTTLTSAGGNWTLGISGVAEGSHSYVAMARDAAGNTSGNSNTRTITVDLTPPNAPVIGGGDTLQKTNTVTLSGTAEPGATVTVLEGATTRGTTTATGGNWTVTVNNVADGAHSYVATARDAAGNTSGNSNTRTIKVDTVAPNAPVIGGANGIQKSTTVTLSGTAEANATVEVFEGATSRGSATATGGNWTVTINTVADGAHSYVATATDAPATRPETPTRARSPSTPLPRTRRSSAAATRSRRPAPSRFPAPPRPARASPCSRARRIGAPLRQPAATGP